MLFGCLVLRLTKKVCYVYDGNSLHKLLRDKGTLQKRRNCFSHSNSQRLRVFSTRRALLFQVFFTSCLQASKGFIDRKTEKQVFMFQSYYIAAVDHLYWKHLCCFDRTQITKPTLNPLNWLTAKPKGCQPYSIHDLIYQLSTAKYCKKMQENVPLEQ